MKTQKNSTVYNTAEHMEFLASLYVGCCKQLRINKWMLMPDRVKCILISTSENLHVKYNSFLESFYGSPRHKGIGANWSWWEFYDRRIRQFRKLEKLNVLQIRKKYGRLQMKLVDPKVAMPKLILELL